MEMLYEDPFSPLTGEVLPELDGFPILEAETEWDMLSKELSEDQPSKHAFKGLQSWPLAEKELAHPLAAEDWLDTKVDILDLLAGDSCNAPMDAETCDDEYVDPTALATLEEVAQQTLLELTKTSDSPVQDSGIDCCQDASSILDIMAEGIELDGVAVNDADNISLFSSITSDDVESILSSTPSSPSSVSIISGSDEKEDSIVFKEPKGRRSKLKKASMSPEEKLAERKARKMQQNKVAALRYRQKKKQEDDLIRDELTELETKNTQLKDKVESMTKEIEYLKKLMAEVYAAKGQKGLLAS